MSFDFPNITTANPKFVIPPLCPIPPSTFYILPFLFYTLFLFYTVTCCLFSQFSLLISLLIYLSNMMIQNCDWRRLHSKACQLSRGAAHAIPSSSFLNEVHSDFLRNRVHVLLPSYLRMLCSTVPWSLQSKLLLITMSPRSSWLSRVDLVEV